MKNNSKNTLNGLIGLNKKILTAAALSALVACGSKNEAPDLRKGESEKSINMKSTITLDNEPIGSIERKALTPEVLRAIRNQALSSGLMPIATAPELNIQAYRIKGLSPNDQYYVAPKLYVYSNSDFGQLVPDKNGLYNVTFNIAILDGLANKGKNLNAEGESFDLPAGMRHLDYEKIKQNIKLNENVTKEFDLATLPGCPSKISINFAGETQDVTPADMASADYCELNQPFAINVKMDQYRLENFMNDMLVNHKVDVSVLYNLTAPLATSELHASFNKSKLYYALKMKLSANYPPYAQVDLEKIVESTLLSMNMNVYILGDYTSQMKSLVDKAIETFFTKMQTSPKVELSQNCSKYACFQLKEVNFSDEENFEVNWMQTSNQKIAHAIHFGSKLGRIDNHVLTLGVNPTDKSDKHGVVFSNKNINASLNPLNEISTGLIPVKGSRILVEPTYLAYEDRDDSKGTNTIVGYEDICTGRNSFGQCTYTTYAIRDYTFEKTGDKVWHEQGHTIQEPLLWLGIKAHFEFTDGRGITCKLSDLNSGFPSTGMIVVIKDTVSCPLFGNSKRLITKFSLINDSFLPNLSYTSGKKTIQDYNGNVVFNNTKPEIYSPEIRAALNLTLLGTGFNTEVSK